MGAVLIPGAPVIDIRFYQAAVVVIPTLLIAVGVAGSALAPATRRSATARRRSVVGGWVLAGAIAASCLVIIAELLALVSVAADETAPWSFVVVLTAITLLVAALGTMAMRPLTEPLRGTWLDGVELVIIVTVSVFAAAAISVALLT